MKNLQDIPLKKIERDESTQARVRTDDDVAGDYAEVLEDLPAPVVFYDGKRYWLGDGWHTVRAHELKRKKMVRCEVRKGTRLDAIIYAAAANLKHGLRMTRADRRRAVWLLITECADWNNCQIARHVCVDEGTVRNVRKEVAGSEIPSIIPVENSQDALLDRLTPAQRAVYNSMTPEERKQELEQSTTDAEDDRLIATEVVMFRILKRLGDDELGKSIRNDLNLYLAHMRGSVGWTEPKRTVADEGWRERNLTDLDRARKLNSGMPGERPRVPILDRMAKKVREAT